MRKLTGLARDSFGAADIAKRFRPCPTIDRQGSCPNRIDTFVEFAASSLRASERLRRLLNITRKLESLRKVVLCLAFWEDVRHRLSQNGKAHFKKICRQIDKDLAATLREKFVHHLKWFNRDPDRPTSRVRAKHPRTVEMSTPRHPDGRPIVVLCGLMKRWSADLSKKEAKAYNRVLADFWEFVCWAGKGGYSAGPAPAPLIAFLDGLGDISACVVWREIGNILGPELRLSAFLARIAGRRPAVLTLLDTIDALEVQQWAQQTQRLGDVL